MIFPIMLPPLMRHSGDDSIALEVKSPMHGSRYLSFITIKSAANPRFPCLDTAPPSLIVNLSLWTNPLQDHTMEDRSIRNSATRKTAPWLSLKNGSVISRDDSLQQNPSSVRCFIGEKKLVTSPWSCGNSFISLIWTSFCQEFLNMSPCRPLGSSQPIGV